MAVEQSTASDDRGSYTGVVYVHGMGEQRRYEEVSRLVDALDCYAHWSFQVAKRPLGRLQEIKARLEPPRGEQKHDVSYIRVYHSSVVDGAAPEELKPFRFYEVYWAPVTAGGRSAWTVVLWMLRQILTPLAVLISPWRDRQRLRRAALHSLWDKARTCDYHEFSATNFAQLLSSYNEFERLDSRYEFKDGSYAEFKHYIERKHGGHPDRLLLLLKLADLWHNQHVKTEFFTLFALLSLGLVLALGFGALLLSVSAITTALSNLMPNLDLAAVTGPIGMILASAHTHVLEVTLAFLGVLGITRFLRDYLGDVQIWSTYQETDINYQKRKEILDNAVQLLTHVLADPKCNRVVVVAHSLGTAIAADALLELGRHNRARNTPAPMVGPIELEKLDQIVTLASPIDKIHYFFESRTGKYHRYNRVVDQVRGDIGEVPYTKNRKPHMHWINFWDVGDVISGPIQTQSNPRNPWLRVDNVRVQSYRFPDPGASHSAYFEHRDVIGHLFEIIFKGAHSLSGFRTNARDQEQLESHFLGPGTGDTLPRLVQYAALAVPWLFACGTLAYALSTPPRIVATCFYAAAIFLVTGLAFFWMASKGQGHLKPMKIPKQRIM